MKLTFDLFCIINLFKMIATENTRAVKTLDHVVDRSPVYERVILLAHLSRLLVRVGILGEIRCVTRLLNLRYEGSGDLLGRGLVPVKCLEPSMLFNVVRSILQATISFRHVGAQEMLH